MSRQLELALGLGIILAAALGCASSSVGKLPSDNGEDADTGVAVLPGEDVQPSADGQTGDNIARDAGNLADDRDGAASGASAPGIVDAGALGDGGALPDDAVPDATATGEGAEDAAQADGPREDAGPPPADFVNLAVAEGEPFAQDRTDPHPSASFTPPMGWQWFNIEGAKCRDGSQFGVFVHFGADPEKLFIYFEGGGACANPGFCTLNPVNVSQQFLSGGESAVASLFLVAVPQAPNGTGVFDLQNPNNPFKDWSQVFIPYCTGDVHAGTKQGAMLEGVEAPQNFHGAANTKRVIARLAGTFKKGLKRFVAGGSSAGGYGAGIHFGAIQDSFPDAYGSALLDASPPLTNDYAPSCLQKRWRDSWGLDETFPSDCGEECRSADGGNLFQIVDYWRRKYPKTSVALISGVHDEIIRLFFSLGNDDCAGYQADPTTLFIGTLGQTYPPARFQAGLQQLRDKYAATGQLATYYMANFPNATAHQCLFRPRFYERAAGSDKPTVAQFLKSWLDGDLQQVGP